MIYFVLTKSPWFCCYQHIYVSSMEDEKLQNLIVELVFFFCGAINKALLVSTQSFALFVYKMKHIQAERYDILPENHSGFLAKI